MANFTIPKINLGSDKKPTKSQELSHDCSTTADFCFPQPIQCVEMIPGSTGVCSVANVVRLAPLVAPSYGVITYNLYHRFVPIAEIYPAFENMLAGQPYYTSRTSSIPSRVPSVTLSSLTGYLLSKYATFSVYKKTTTGGTSWTSGKWFALMNYAEGDTDLPAAITAYNTAFSFGSYNVLSIDNRAEGVTSTYLDNSGGAVTIDGADYLVSFSSNSNEYIFAFRLTFDGLHLRKILLGLGYQLDIENSNSVSVLPIIAYFKGWFDMFCPKQTVTWTSTNAFKFMDTFCELSINFDITIGAGADVARFFISVIDDLVNCWYTSDPDFVSAHISSTAVAQTSASITYSPAQGSATDTTQPSLLAPYSGNPGQPSAYNTSISANLIKLLFKMTSWVNKNSIIGGRLDYYMRTHFGADYINAVDSYRIGESVTLCDIDPVISQAETTEKTLGAYAGAGIGKDNGKQVSFKADTFGYWLTYAVIVPASSGYAQGVDPKLYHKDRFTFYNPEFDAVGFQVTSKDQIIGSRDVSINGTSSAPGSFGYIPRYSDYKVAQNVLNGDVSRRSTRASYLPYTLDRYISPGEMRGVESSTAGTYQVYAWSPTIPVASTEWRYVGKYGYLGNFDRIFQNEGVDSVLMPNSAKYNPKEDNFIIHNFIKFEYIAPMLSLSDSFDTDSDRNNDVSVDKA